MTEPSNKELLDALGIEAEKKNKATLTAEQERVVAGFEEIQQFVKVHGRLPSNNPEADIFERIYATRLEQIRRQEQYHSIVVGIDRQGLLNGAENDENGSISDLDNKALLAELGVDAKEENSVTHLVHVKSRAEVKAAEEIANRTPCRDFNKFKPIFTAVQDELKKGIRQTIKYKDNAIIEQSNMFILSGQTIYIAEMSEFFTSPGDHKDSRLRAIYGNGTESNILMRSLQRALNKDDTARRITEPDTGPLFSGVPEKGDLSSGTIYVCRSQSDHPYIAKNRDLIHKIGVTTTSTKRRFSNADSDPTFLMAKVDVVATYKLVNINRNGLEKMLHRFFDSARLDIEIKDRFGKPIKSKEWFCVPLERIDDAIEHIKDESIVDYRYDAEEAVIKKIQ